MKQKDIATIVVVVIISGALSILLSKLVISTPKNRQQKVEVVDVISAEFTRPSDKVFNNTAINPTQTIKIGNDTNAKPFNSGQ